MLRNSGMRPMPSGNSRQTSSVTPGRMVGLIMPTTPRQLENAMRGPFDALSIVGARRGSTLRAALGAVFLDERDHGRDRLHRIRVERMLVDEGVVRAFVELEIHGAAGASIV